MAETFFGYSHMRSFSYILLIFALLMQGAVARTLPMAMSNEMLPQQHTVAPPCHETAEAEGAEAIGISAHACCADAGVETMAAQCHADGEADACLDDCSQCQAHCASFAGLASTPFFASSYSSGPVLSNASALSTRFWGVLTPPPSA
ncbi:hypothetical protein [Ferrimonas gelatinilytica]|uniref:hypothetical protein n=1 Tax=Ferrimonas gelatinilytica TaxID=1255257 RepID=UPI0031E62C5E